MRLFKYILHKILLSKQCLLYKRILKCLQYKNVLNFKILNKQWEKNNNSLKNTKNILKLLLKTYQFLKLT